MKLIANGVQASGSSQTHIKMGMQDSTKLYNEQFFMFQVGKEPSP